MKKIVPDTENTEKLKSRYQAYLKKGGFLKAAGFFTFIHLAFQILSLRYYFKTIFDDQPNSWLSDSWKYISFPLFSLPPSPMQNEYIWFFLIANSVIWGIVLALLLGLMIVEGRAMVKEHIVR